MSLDQRLVRARDDYRAVGAAPFAPVIDPGPPGLGPTRRWLVAAAVLVALAAGVGVARLNSPDDGTTRTDTPTTAGPPTTIRRTVVLLDEQGPYRDGQEVVVRVPDDIGADLTDPDGIGLCAAVEIGPAGSGRTQGSCALMPDLLVPGRGTPTAATIRLRRVVATALGTVDCAAEGVECRLEVPTAEGDVRRSAVLPFVPDPPPAPRPRLSASPGDAPGTIVLHAAGLTPDPSWLALRAERPDLAADVPAFVVSRCSIGASLGGVDGPFGEDLWDLPGGGPEGATCEPPGMTFVLDPDRPDQTVTATLPTVVRGRVSADCRVDRCYLDVGRTVVDSFDRDGTVRQSMATVASVPLSRDWAWPAPIRPSLTIDTPGPHLPGQTVTVTVAGLAEGETSSIGICHVLDPWGCGYPDGGFDLGNGSYAVPLLEARLRGCGPEDCYLQLDGGDQASPPLAVAPLDTPG